MMFPHLPRHARKQWCASSSRTGPKPESQVVAEAKAAEIPERSLIAAADALGVRTRKLGAR
jgi:hypothetical protein